jgi:hypothetical protein
MRTTMSCMQPLDDRLDHPEPLSLISSRSHWDLQKILSGGGKRRGVEISQWLCSLL